MTDNWSFDDDLDNDSIISPTSPDHCATPSIASSLIKHHSSLPSSGIKLPTPTSVVNNNPVASSVANPTSAFQGHSLDGNKLVEGKDKRNGKCDTVSVSTIKISPPSKTTEVEATNTPSLAVSHKVSSSTPVGHVVDNNFATLPLTIKKDDIVANFSRKDLVSSNSAKNSGGSHNLGAVPLPPSNQDDMNDNWSFDDDDLDDDSIIATTSPDPYAAPSTHNLSLPSKALVTTASPLTATKQVSVSSSNLSPAFQSPKTKCDLMALSSKEFTNSPSPKNDIFQHNDKSCHVDNFSKRLGYVECELQNASGSNNSNVGSLSLSSAPGSTSPPLLATVSSHSAAISKFNSPLVPQVKNDKIWDTEENQILDDVDVDADKNIVEEIMNSTLADSRGSPPHHHDYKIKDITKCKFLVPPTKKMIEINSLERCIENVDLEYEMRPNDATSLNPSSSWSMIENEQQQQGVPCLPDKLSFMSSENDALKKTIVIDDPSADDQKICNTKGKIMSSTFTTPPAKQSIKTKPLSSLMGSNDNISTTVKKSNLTSLIGTKSSIKLSSSSSPQILAAQAHNLMVQARLQRENLIIQSAQKEKELAKKKKCEEEEKELRMKEEQAKEKERLKKVAEDEKERRKREEMETKEKDPSVIDVVVGEGPAFNCFDNW
uniref:Uncharacterized protein n=1 Tax=Corethron hystrix TaxID=216773 RepID=A0A7S1FLQ2_9STRA